MLRMIMSSASRLVSSQGQFWKGVIKVAFKQVKQFARREAGVLKSHNAWENEKRKTL